MDSTVVASLLGVVSAGVLGVLGVVGRRYEGREARVVSVQGEALEDLERQNARLRLERDEAQADVARLRSELATALLGLAAQVSR